MKVYCLREQLANDPGYVADVQACTLDDRGLPGGLAGAYGLFGTEQWWKNIANGVAPVTRLEGTIKRIYFEGMNNEGRGFEMQLPDGRYFFERAFRFGAGSRRVRQSGNGRSLAGDGCGRLRTRLRFIHAPGTRVRDGAGGGSNQQSGGAYDSRCPSSPPANGAGCDVSMGPLQCEYGGDALGRGTTIAYCASDTAPYTSFQWLTISSTVAANPPQCATSFAAAQQASCPVGGAIACDYDEGRCACVCQGTTLSWQCRSRSDVESSGTDPSTGPAPACPAARPLAGTRCSDEGQQCAYSASCGETLLSFGSNMQCMHGYWYATVNTAAACKQYSCPGVPQPGG
jgi:hypothetical protein